MYNALGKKIPQTYFLGRYNFTGLELSSTKTKERIDKGEYSSWDDIRLPFMQALKRRGYQPHAFLKYSEMTGLSQADKTVSKDEFFKSIDHCTGLFDEAADGGKVVGRGLLIVGRFGCLLAGRCPKIGRV